MDSSSNMLNLVHRLRRPDDALTENIECIKATQDVAVQAFTSAGIAWFPHGIDTPRPLTAAASSGRQQQHHQQQQPVSQLQRPSTAPVVLLNLLACLKYLICCA